ncbi:eukaryotic translation initiation factor 2-alpha kinase-like [Physella acuta]|uniref:eukaryotic translation initiation factor 2-alpha kinase-like n=1 Tax=Physella acuta TaxID=109671 RepID=UPI0027DBDB9F|nr:eukaryotic translation initiation factor 2-alpha kinase-like [Physella acuta]
MVNSKNRVFLSKVIKALASLSALLACSSATLTKTEGVDLDQNVNRIAFDRSSSGIKSALKHADKKNVGYPGQFTKQEFLEQASESEINHFHKSTITDAIESNCDIFYVLVSTIDGRVSALDLHNQGHLAWSVQADTRPLYSSSLANMEMIRNGKKLRLIPSLDGALYQFDGEKVEAIPMSADSLLSSTYRLSDDSMIVGSKELQNFGLDLRSGKVQFSCSSEGCNTAESQSSAILVLTRSTQVVRSVDIKNGIEKWNFSVGQHQINLPSPNSQLDEDLEDAQDIPLFTHTSDECSGGERFVEDLGDEDLLRLLVPEGRVVALSREDSSLVTWEHKFDAPIAKAWLLRQGKLEPMSLFDGRHIPTLTTYTPDDNDSLAQPLLYIGSHQKLLYIQPSPQMENIIKSFTRQRIGHIFDPDVKVSWRPYLNTASVRTPIFGGNRQPAQLEKSPDVRKKKDSTSLTVWHEDYPFDTGYFLYPEFADLRASKKEQVLLIEDTKHGQQEHKWQVTWKLVLVGVIFSVALHLCLIKLFKKTDHTLEKGSEEVFLVSSDSAPVLQENSGSFGKYTSRFATDFECLHCLGKGGFGVVFEAVNKVDDQHYAVKRTMLPRSDGAKEKVLREVKVLAKLEHVGIVRYFNAWVESPPAGWQEERDKWLPLSDESGHLSATYSPCGVTSSGQCGGRSSRTDDVSRDSSWSDGFSLGTSVGAGPPVEAGPPAEAGPTFELDMTGTDSVIFEHNSSTQTCSERQQEGSQSPEVAADKELTSLGRSSLPATKYFLYIQMQLYQKDTLKDWLNNNTLQRDRHLVLDIFSQIASAVDYVHTCGLMHRDLKPSNIFFSADGTVKVGDFGLVTALTVQQDLDSWSDSNSDKHTAEVGTTLYMSPEQVAKKPYDFKVDIFSLGLIFLELWIPFSTQMERMRTLQDAKRQILPERFLRELPTESQLVYQMTSGDPTMRPTAKEILNHQLFAQVAPSGAAPRRRTTSEV